MNGPQETAYPPNTAGRLLTTAVPTILLGTKINEVETMLREGTRTWETINYLYVLNNRQELQGVISIKEVFRAPQAKIVDELMVRDVITVRAHSDQERVAMLAIKHSLKAVPVVDKDNHFLGIVPSDTILNILNSEAAEDVLRLAGIHPARDQVFSVIKASIFTHLHKRLPWLILGIIGGLGAAVLVGFFEDSLKANLLLAAFIPTIVYIGDSVGNQAQTLVIRSLAVEGKIRLFSYLKKEALVTLGIALTLSLLVGAAILLLWQSPFVALTLTVAVFATIIAAVTIGVGLPYAFGQLKLDPAIASGPFATVIRDIVSILIYFSTAHVILSLFPAGV